jgi:general secretion pathway protein A
LYQGDFGHVYDLPTIEAVARLQARRGVAQDGRIGPQTLLILYQESRLHSPPRLAAAEEGGP